MKSAHAVHMSRPRTGNYLRGVLSAIALLTIMFIFNAGALASDPRTQAGARRLFHPTTAKGNHNPNSRDHVVRSKYVQVDFSLFADPLGPSASKFTIGLFDESFVAVRDRVQFNGKTSITWFGHVEGIPYSQVTLVIGRGDSDRIMVGGIIGLAAEYAFNPAGNGVHEIQQLAPQRFSEDDRIRPSIVENSVESPRHGSIHTGMEQAPQGITTIDILIVYTPALAAYCQSVELCLQYKIDSANRAFEKSAVDAQLRMVYFAQVNYSESGSMSRDLGRAINPNDGYMDEIHTLRNQYGADLVHLVAEQGPEDGYTLGYASLMSRNLVGPQFAPYAFSVSATRLGISVFAHEIGHNMGAEHERAKVIQDNLPCYPDDCGAFPYSYGNTVITNTNPTSDNPLVGFLDTMSYGVECQRPEYSAGYCRSINQFSNPNLYYQIWPTGIDESQPNSSNNAKTLNNTAPIIAAFRQQVVLDSTPTPVPTATATPGTGGCSATGMAGLIPMSSHFVDPNTPMPQAPDPKNTTPMSRRVQGKTIAVPVQPSAQGKDTPGNRENSPQSPANVSVGPGSPDYMFKTWTAGQTGGTGQRFYDMDFYSWFGPFFNQCAGTLAQAPAIAEYLGQFQVVALGPDNQVYQAFYDPYIHAWRGWFQLSVPSAYNSGFTSAPAVVSYRGQFHVFIRGSNHHIWHAYYDWYAGRWYGWADVSGMASASAPAAAVYTGRNDRNNLQLMFLSDDGNYNLMHMIYNDGGNEAWKGPSIFATGPWSSAPAMSQYLDQLQIWLVRNKTLNYFYYDLSTGWHADTVSGAVGSAPAITQYLDQFQVFYVEDQSSGGSYAHQQYYVPGVGWRDGGRLGTPVSSAPAVGAFLNQFQVWWRNATTP